MRIQKPLNITLFALVALLLGLLLARAFIAERLVTAWLQGFGLHDVAVDISQLGPGHSALARLDFTLKTDTGRFRLELGDAALDYEPKRLIQGRVDNLAVSSLAITFENLPGPSQPSTPVGKALEPLGIIAGLRKTLRDYVIADSFTVQNAMLKGEAFGVLQNRPLRLTGTNDRKRTVAELIISGPNRSEPEDGLRKILFTQVSEERIAVALPQAGASAAQAAELDLGIADTRIDGNYSIDPGALMHWLRPFTHTPDITQAEPVTGTISADFGSADALQSQVTARTAALSTDTVRADNLELRLQLETPLNNPFRVIGLGKNSTVTTDGLVVGTFAIGRSQVNINGALSLTDGAWQYAGTVRTDALSVGYGPQTVALRDIGARLEINPEILQVDGEISPAAATGTLGIMLAHRFKDDHGSLSVTPLQPIGLNPEDYRLSQLLTPWPYAFDLLAGTLRLSAKGKWTGDRPLRLTTVIQLDNAGGHVDQLVFSGLSLNHELEILPEIRSVHSSKITLDHLDSGVTAHSISTMLTLKPAETGPSPVIQIQGLHGEIFDGAFSSADFVFDPNKETNRFTIAARDIDLAKVVETQQLKDIAVTGRIDGTIPVQVNKDGVFIEHGAFINHVRAGTIRYNPASGTDQLKQNPLTGIALDALKDFRYDHLSADVNFTPDGMLRINLKLKGTSPELETDRPVHLNINTEQNLLSLLKSLRYAEGISANIDKKVRRQYKARN